MQAPLAHVLRPACLESYIASQAVSGGFVKTPDKWLFERGRQSSTGRRQRNGRDRASSNRTLMVGGQQKVARDVARKQAARLPASVMLAPQTGEGQTEVVDCIPRNCADAEHAEVAMTELLDGALRVSNLTAGIASIANKTRRPKVPPLAATAAHSTRRLHWPSPLAAVRQRGAKWLRLRAAV